MGGTALYAVLGISGLWRNVAWRERYAFTVYAGAGGDISCALVLALGRKGRNVEGGGGACCAARGLALLPSRAGCVMTACSVSALDGQAVRAKGMSCRSVRDLRTLEETILLRHAAIGIALAAGALRMLPFSFVAPFFTFSSAVDEGKKGWATCRVRGVIVLWNCLFCCSLLALRMASRDAFYAVV